jgi:hypothetical protein
LQFERPLGGTPPAAATELQMRQIADEVQAEIAADLRTEAEGPLAQLVECRKAKTKEAADQRRRGEGQAASRLRGDLGQHRFGNDAGRGDRERLALQSLLEARQE